MKCGPTMLPLLVAMGMTTDILQITSGLQTCKAFSVSRHIVPTYSEFRRTLDSLLVLAYWCIGGAFCHSLHNNSRVFAVAVLSMLSPIIFCSVLAAVLLAGYVSEICCLVWGMFRTRHCHQHHQTKVPSASYASMRAC